MISQLSQHRIRLAQSRVGRVGARISAVWHELEGAHARLLELPEAAPSAKSHHRGTVR
jgi:hypothetical protein